MQTFSQRKGIKPVSSHLQVESMDENLRNSIWNVLDVVAWGAPGFMGDVNRYGRIVVFSQQLWANFYKLPIDRRPTHPAVLLEYIRDTYFGYSWNEVYDFLQFIIQPELALPKTLPKYLNEIFERESAGYRIVANVIVDVTAGEEVAMLEEAIRDTAFSPISNHLRRALELLADRTNPDYRNSIKESVSAVESIAKIAANDPTATLGSALRALEKNGKMHQALRDGFLKLYGYTNDADGIRHAMMEESTLTSADAKYFLMSCTAFTNYLKAQLATSS